MNVASFPPNHDNHPPSGVLLQQIESALAGTEQSRLPQHIFDNISRTLERDLQNMDKREWVRRPRIYFILHQLQRHDTMDAFIAAGLSDSSFPFKGRSDLPKSLTFHEVESFL